MSLPGLVEVSQRLWDQRVPEVAGCVRAEMDRVDLKGLLPAGGRVAITVGSRGLANLPLIVRALVEEVRRRGAEPFLVPAMGTHGGATAEGQVRLLAGLGVTEESAGAEICSTLEVELVGRTESGFPVYVDRAALGADGIVVMNRIKEHTDFAAPLESGLAKMLAVGLGNQEGARALHARGAGALARAIPEAARVVRSQAPVLVGLAVLDNAYGETAEIRALRPEEMEAGEQTLLRRVKRRAPRLPFREIDVLVVERMGKEISGVGMDTKVLGRRLIRGEQEFGGVRINRVMVLDLSDVSYGNAVGIGLADATTQRLVDKIDRQATCANMVHTGFWERGKIPLTFADDREAIAAAVSMGTRWEPGQVRLVRIRDTLHLDRLQVSEALLEEVRRHPRMEVVGEPQEMAFDASGRLI